MTDSFNIQPDSKQRERIYKIIVSLAFGLLGFCINFFPLDVIIPPHKASFVWGLVFPMLISLSWGWKYGLLSATLGLGGQTMWFLWLPRNGWAPFVSIILYNLWFVWHGWFAERKRTGLFSTFYGVELPFRVFSTLMHLTLFPWVFRFNPSPWAPQMVQTTVPSDFVHFVVFKLIIEGLMVLLLADVLMDFGMFRKILLLDRGKRFQTGYFLSGSLLLGLIFWIIAGFADCFFFSQKLNFLKTLSEPTLADSLILNVPPYELFTRIVFVLTCLVAGLIISKYVSRYKASEDALVKSKDQYRALVETSNDWVWEVNQDWLYTYSSPKSQDILGYGQEEIIGKTPFDFMPKDETERIREIFMNMAQEKKSFAALENVFSHKDGRDIVLETNGVPFLSPDGNLAGYRGIDRDITERKQAEIERRNMFERFQALVDSLDSLVYVADFDTYELLFMNKYGEKIWGESTGKICWQTLQTGRGGPCEFCTNNRLLDAQGNATGVYVWEFQNTADNEWYECRDQAIRWSDGRLVRMEIAANITDRKKAEQEKESLKSRLVQAQKMEAIGTLAGGIAHDFNNLLTIILGNTELLLMDLPEGSKLKTQLDEIVGASKRASDLVRQILSFSRQVDQELQPIQPAMVVREIIKLLRSTIPTSVEIRQYIDPECGTIIADPTQIHQVLMNLATNAVHAMQEKGILEIRLELTTLAADDLKHRPDMVAGPYVRLSVSDTGTGMNEQTLERIFDPFFTTKDVGKGTGLGLSVVHGIVSAHHGMITVDSKPGKGTTFSVYFAKADSIEVELAETVLSLPTGSERILFIDDEEGIVELWEKILKRLGYKVTTQTSSTGALKLFSSNPGAFDLVITDQTMPGMTGAELTLQLMAIRKDIPIILCTGHSSQLSIEEAIDMRIRKFFMKPMDIRQLTKAIREILDGK